MLTTTSLLLKEPNKQPKCRKKKNRPTENSKFNYVLVSNIQKKRSVFPLHIDHNFIDSYRKSGIFKAFCTDSQQLI